MVNKWVSYNLLINGIYWGYNPLILTIDPNFQRDIQVMFVVASLIPLLFGCQVSPMEIKMVRPPTFGRLVSVCGRFVLEHVFCVHKVAIQVVWFPLLE